MSLWHQTGRRSQVRCVYRRIAEMAVEERRRRQAKSNAFRVLWMHGLRCGTTSFRAVSHTMRAQRRNGQTRAYFRCLSYTRRYLFAVELAPSKSLKKDNRITLVTPVGKLHSKFCKRCALDEFRICCWDAHGLELHARDRRRLEHHWDVGEVQAELRKNCSK